ncbi:MAG: hypothetical protein NXY57DRAFT_957719 [Lentinula lateritia]|uniref:BTB domain-containing protein n=1 Tax=Lentinula lateritia TaxID=40482 RepID=A0ABQ8W1F4_9AGAR|nr:MAG: hypothetical protein NXY57DRAFT_957719 [Lentinula lateritia]KAJ4500875.1 hypothetical protein C8R41DRAFT_862975 [Lentinula lateritia]
MNIRDKTFYSDFKIFKVENVLFKVPTDALTAESEVFRDLLKLPPVPSNVEGLSDENPIHLEGVLSNDFRQLLRILCPRFKSTQVLSFTQWTSVLKLADQYMMDSVRSHAIFIMDQQSDFDPIDKIVVARRYSIKSWLTPTYNKILQRPQSFTQHDLERLGSDTVLKLVALRDRLKPMENSRFGSFGLWSLGTKREAISVDFTEALEETLSDCYEIDSESKQSASALTVNAPTDMFIFAAEPSGIPATSATPTRRFTGLRNARAGRRH